MCYVRFVACCVCVFLIKGIKINSVCCACVWFACCVCVMLCVVCVVCFCVFCSVSVLVVCFFFWLDVMLGLYIVVFVFFLFF